MPRAAKRRIDPDAVYEAWTSVALDVPNTVISRGTRLRGSEAAVQSAPWAFVTAGTPQHEWPSELGTTTEPEPSPVPEADVTVNAEPEPLDDQVELTKDLRVLVGHGSKPRLMVFRKGQRFHRDSEVRVLLAGRGWFEEARS